MCRPSMGRVGARATLTAHANYEAFTCRKGMQVSLSMPALSWPISSLLGSWSAGFASKVADPARPKRPASAWVHFLSDFRKANKEIPGKEVMTSASQKWKTMSVVQKKPFQDIYDTAKKEYDKAQEEYVKSGKKEDWTRDPEKPKKPISGFFLFLDGYRKKNASLKPTEASKLAAAIWKDMGKEQKKPYEAQYAEEKVKYDEAMKLYKASGKEEAWKERTGRTGKTGKTGKTAAAGKTKKGK